MAKKDEMSEQEENDLRKNPINNFTCQSCKDSEVMNFAAFKKHLEETHGIKADQMKGTKQMIMHMDGAKWFSSTYQWTLENGIKFQQYTMMARNKDSYMRY